MAHVSASVYTSHVPAIGAALDQGRADEPYWQPVFAGYEASKAWMRAVLARDGQLSARRIHLHRSLTRGVEQDAEGKG